MTNNSLKLKDKTYGIITIICIAIFSVCVYMYTLSILSVAAIYSFLMIKTIMITYSRYIGYLDKKSFFTIGAISFLIIYVGYYFAYAAYYYPYINSINGNSFFNVLLNLRTLLNRFDKKIAPGSLFFIMFTFLCGMAMNRQYMKHVQVDDLSKRINKFKKEVGLEDNKEKDEKVKTITRKLVIVGFLTLCLGVFNDYRFSQYISINRYKNELSELKTISKEAYEAAKKTLKGQGNNYHYCSYDYYIKGESNLLYITADLNGENYTLYYDQEPHGTTLEMNWGEWTEHNGRYIHITLDVKAKGKGYAIINITNDVNDECIKIFVDNFNH